MTYKVTYTAFNGTNEAGPYNTFEEACEHAEDISSFEDITNTKVVQDGEIVARFIMGQRVID